MSKYAEQLLQSSKISGQLAGKFAVVEGGLRRVSWDVSKLPENIAGELAGIRSTAESQWPSATECRMFLCRMGLD